ncbi:hypothetical protein SS50377_26340 [Spironucleus salmonicida]|uniref:Transmembrane protein n=1 Tax=Spironucleus salmonicida TaxID=348837 RepID=V6LT17_9EUKA|nr:hypothetical protein SS50377_26340 [Spironucleus salmonicida]|eukprot:EST47792.1 Hypothetical protein SS50377_12192 [Spironucleus salmonicida]
MFLVFQCTLPSVVEFIGPNPIPFVTNCPTTSRGELSIIFVTNAGQEQKFVSKNMTITTELTSFDFTRMVDFTKIKSAHIYGNMTLNGKTQIVGIQYSPECTYAMTRRLVGDKLYQFLVFPRHYDCKPYNFTDISYRVFIRRLGINGDDLIITTRATQFELNFNISIDPATTTTQNIRYAYLQFLGRKYNLTEITSAQPCIKSYELTKTDAYLYIRPTALVDCYCNVPIQAAGSALSLRFSSIEHIYYQFAINTGTANTLQISMTVVSPTTFISAQEDLFIITLDQIQRNFPYCNQTISQLYVEKPYYNITGYVAPIETATALCIPFIGVFIALPNLPFVYIKSRQNQLIFDFNSQFLKYDLLDQVQLKFTGNSQNVLFITPKLLANCLFTADLVMKRGNKVIAISKQFCDPSASEVSGYATTWQNYKNTGSADTFDMFLGVEYEGSGDITSKLSPKYSFKRNVVADQKQYIPFQYISSDELQLEQAQQAAFETRNYNYKTWVSQHWWIFTLTVIAIFVASFSLLYGCKYPCKYIMVTKKVKVMAQQKAKRKMKMIV